MTIRVEPSTTLVFGVMSAEVVVTHVRFRRVSAPAAPVVKVLGSSVTIDAGERLRIPSTAMDMTYPEGDMTNTHMRELVDGYWDGEEFQIDCMTASNTVVSDSGYSQQTHDAWTITNE